MRRTASGARRITVVAVASIVAFVLTACAPYASADAKLQAQAQGALPGAVQDKLAAAVKDAMKLGGASAGLVGVWAPWAGSWVAGLGTTTAGGSTPVTPDMRFRIADNTMPMTCTVLLALVDEGTVGLDDPVTKYLPGFVGIDGVTLRELCQNTSGFSDYTAALNATFVSNPLRQWPELELVSDGIAGPPVGKPGEKFGMARTNFVLLGMALRSATGSSWQDLYQKYVFGRLGMSSSSLPSSNVFDLPGTHPVGYATPYAAGAPTCGTVVDVTRLSPSIGQTAVGVVSTISDLRAFAQSLAAGSLLSRASAKAQMTGITIGSDWYTYGLGVTMLGPLRGSSGALPGSLSAMFSDPVSGLTVVVALNNSTSGEPFAQALAQRLVSIVAKAPAKQKNAKIVSGLPWSEEQAAADLQKSAVCPPAAPAK